MTITKWQTLREEARRADGRFGSYTVEESDARLGRAYQEWEQDVGGDLMAYMERCAQQTMHRRSHNVSQMVDVEDLKMEAFVDLHRRIAKEVDGDAPSTQNKRSMVRTIVSRKAQLLREGTHHWGNDRASKRLDQRLDAFWQTNGREPTNLERRDMASEVVAEIRRETPKDPAQPDFDVQRQRRHVSLDTPLSEDSATTRTDMLANGDQAPEADPEDAAVYGTVAQRAAVSSTVDLLASQRVAERAEGAREAMGILMPEHPISATVAPAKRRTIVRTVTNTGIREALDAGCRDSGRETAATKSAFAPWPEADHQQRAEIVSGLDELSGGDDDRLAALWNRCLDASLRTEDD